MFLFFFFLIPLHQTQSFPSVVACKILAIAYQLSESFAALKLIVESRSLGEKLGETPRCRRPQTYSANTVPIFRILQRGAGREGEILSIGPVWRLCVRYAENADEKQEQNEREREGKKREVAAGRS